MALPAIISPSVLASDFGQLTAECKRMIKGGAEWLHMGMSSTASPTSAVYSQNGLCQMSWTGTLSLFLRLCIRRS